MIIDLILDRYDGSNFDPVTMFKQCQDYGGFHGDMIATAYYNAFKRGDLCRRGADAEIKRALKLYVIEQEYNLNILTFIDMCDWLVQSPGYDFKKDFDICENKPKTDAEYLKLKRDCLDDLSA